MYAAKTSIDAPGSNSCKYTRTLDKLWSLCLTLPGPNITYSQVVHIDLEPPLGDHVSKDMIHECLKNWRGVAKTKEHYSGYKEAERSDECCFPLVFLPNANVVIAPLNIKLSEQCGVLHIIDQLWDEGERIPIVNSVGIEILIILTRS